MRIWLIQDAEPMVGIDEGAREMRCGTLARVLAASGHDVLWWASTFDHSRKKHRYTKPCTIDMSPNLKIRFLHGPGYSRNQSFSRFLHQRAIARSFARELHDFPTPDVVVGNVPSPELAEETIVFGKNAGVPVIIFVEDRWPDIYLTMFPKLFRGLVKTALTPEYRRIRRVFRESSSILAVSDAYLNWALAHAGRARRNLDGVFPLGYPAPAEVLGESNSANLPSKYGIERDKMIVTFVGVFGFSYDLETVVKAAGVLDSRGDERIRIILVGDGDSAPRLREVGRNAKSLTFTGWLDQQSVLEVLRCSSVGLAAYHRRATQTLPYKPFEYMAAGLPLLSSLLGELDDLIKIEQIGLRYQAGDVNSLVESLQWMAANPTERQAMGARARRLFVDRFSADVIYPRLAHHIEKVATAV